MHVASDAGEELRLLVLGVGGAKGDAEGVPGLAFKAFPEPGQLGGGTSVRGVVGSTIASVRSLPHELGRGKVELGPGEGSKLVSGVRVPTRHGRVGVQEGQRVMDRLVRGRGGRRTSREVSRNLGRPDELPNQVPEGLGANEDPGREVREKRGVVDPLHPSDRGGDRIVDDEVVIHIGVAGRLRGSMNPSTHHRGPIGSLQNVRLEVPIASNNKRSLETFNENGGVLQDEQVGFREAFADPEINAENVDPALAQASNPRRVKPMPEPNRDGVGTNSGDANALPGKNPKSSRAMVLRGAVGKGDRGVPPQAASLALGGTKSIVSDDLGFLGEEDVSPGLAKNVLLKRPP